MVYGNDILKIATLILKMDLVMSLYLEPKFRLEFVT